MIRIRHLTRSLILALATLIISAGATTTTVSADAEPSLSSARTATFGPGRFGEIVVPMSAQEAIATGMARWSQGPCGRVLRLVAPYGPRVFPLTTVVGEGSLRVVGVATRDGTFRTQDGLGVGSTLRDLRDFYGHRLSKVRAGMYDDRYVEVRNSAKSLVFLFTAGTTSNGSRVQGVTVARGEAITGYDGC